MNSNEYISEYLYVFINIFNIKKIWLNIKKKLD